MNFKVLFTLLISLTLVACSKVEHPAEENHENHAGVTFSAKSGLHVPASTAKYIGLQVADVEERNVALKLQFTATVYQGLQESRLASLSAIVPALAHATAFVSMNDAQLLQRNHKLKVRTQENAILSGVILSQNAALTNASGQVEVLVGIQDGAGHLRTGQQVFVAASLGEEKAVVRVPGSALLQTTEGTFVYTVSGDRFVRTPVKLGTTNADFSEITDGLYAGDRVVTHPVMTLWMAELQSIRGGKSCADGH